VLAEEVICQIQFNQTVQLLQSCKGEGEERREEERDVSPQTNN